MDSNLAIEFSRRKKTKVEAKLDVSHGLALLRKNLFPLSQNGRVAEGPLNLSVARPQKTLIFGKTVKHIYAAASFLGHVGNSLATRSDMDSNLAIEFSRRKKTKVEAKLDVSHGLALLRKNLFPTPMF